MRQKINEFLAKIFFKSPKIIFINFYRIFLRKKVFNIKRLPENKPAILAINHATGADSIIILASIRKKIIFLADSRCFETRFTNFFFRKITDCIPLFKKQFTKNLTSFKKIFEVFNISKKKNKNVLLGIFPEGKLNKEENLDEFYKGSAYLSYKMELPVIPVYLSNIFKGPVKKKWYIRRPVLEGFITIFANLFKKIHIFIGEPINPLAENIIDDFNDLIDKNTNKEIIEKINISIKEEFNKLENEAKLILKELSNEESFYNKNDNAITISSESEDPTGDSLTEEYI